MATQVSPSDPCKTISLFCYSKREKINVQVNVDRASSDKISTNALKILAAEKIFNTTKSEEYVLQKIMFFLFRDDEKDITFKFKDDNEHFILVAEVNRIFLTLRDESCIKLTRS